MKNKFALKSIAGIIAMLMLLSVGSVYAGSGKGRGIECDTVKGVQGNWDRDGKGARDGFDIDKMCKDLNVTPEQQEKLTSERKEHRKTMKDLRDKIHSQRDALGKELDKTKSDKNKLDKITTDMKKTMDEMVDQRLNSVLKIKEILTPEQYKQFVDQRNKHFKEMKKNMKKGMKKGKKMGPPPPEEMPEE